MVFALRSLVVWGASPTTDGSATRPAGRNPRLLRRANTFTRFISGHSGQATSRFMKTCGNCGGQNPDGATSCQTCTRPFNEIILNKPGNTMNSISINPPGPG